MRKTLIKRKKSGKSRRSINNKRTRKHNKRGGGLGSDIRQKLVTLCRQNDLKEYDNVVENEIMPNPKDFLDHLKKNISTFKPENVVCLERGLRKLQMKGVSAATYYLREHVMPALKQTLVDSYNFAENTIKSHSGQEDLDYDKLWKKYDGVTQHIINNYRMYDSDNPASKYYNPDGKFGFFNYLRNNINIGLNERREPYIIKCSFEDDNVLDALERSLTQLQEDGIPESMDYLFAVINRVPGKLCDKSI